MIKDASSPVYALAGGYEFSTYVPEKPPTPKRLRFLAKAYELLRYDLLYLTPAERALLAAAGVSPKPNWAGSERFEQRIVHAPGGPKVGVIVLPAIATNAKSVPYASMQQVHSAVRALREKTKLVVVLSSWGYYREQDLLDSKGDLPDILLGSGPGIGQIGVVAGGGKTAWIRSYSQGRSIMRIEIMAFPDRDSTFKWTEEQNIRMTLFGLTDQYQEDPQMLSLMQRMGTD